ncbi:glycogen synthase GlgA [Gammaproteobacteria bacterium]|nr:glycogen synthase GlgA [Gammaproteobacteria bacterium]
MRVLSVASECVPLVKTGGLADVVGALPAALAVHGVEMRVLLPAYRGLKPGKRARLVWQGKDPSGQTVTVSHSEVAGISLLLLDAPQWFDRPGSPYLDENGQDFADNAFRFAALSWVAARLCIDGLDDGWRADLLHAHDWQAGLAAAYLHFQQASTPSLLTIHNIAFQGIARSQWRHALALPASGFTPQGYEYFGNISMLKAGIVYSSRVTTVSARYAEELMRPQFGMGLEGVLASRRDHFHGILNGVDTSVWSPERETHAAPYHANALATKDRNRKALLQQLGLDKVDGPLLIVVSRLTQQKGLDLLPDLLPAFFSAGGALAMLASGDAALEARFGEIARAHPGRMSLHVGYNEELAHQLFAGGDAVLVPSRFEPCGLTQLYGLCYGTVPVVAATGGLADTVIDANPAALASGVATGIAFHPVDQTALGEALRRLQRLFADRKGWRRIQRRGMRQPIGWENSAQHYATLYQTAIDSAAS